MPPPPFNPTDVADTPPEMLPDQESYSEMANEVEAKPAAAGLKLDSVTIRPAKNGGFIAQCSKSAPSAGDGGIGPSYESNDYAFKSIEELHAFIDQELGGAAAPDLGTGSTVGMNQTGAQIAGGVPR